LCLSRIHSLSCIYKCLRACHCASHKIRVFYIYIYIYIYIRVLLLPCAFPFILLYILDKCLVLHQEFLWSFLPPLGSPLGLHCGTLSALMIVDNCLGTLLRARQEALQHLPWSYSRPPKTPPKRCKRVKWRSERSPSAV